MEISVGSLATEEKKECSDCGRPLDGENCPAFGVHDAPENRGEEKKKEKIEKLAYDRHTLAATVQDLHAKVNEIIDYINGK